MNDSALHDHVLARRDIIVETFRRELGRQSQAAGQLAPSLLIGTLPEFFDQLAVELRAGAGASLAEFALPAAGAHGRTRWAQGFDLREVVREYGVLHHVILRDIFEQGVTPSLGALQTLQNAINMGIADAVVGFTDQTLRLQETLHAKELELESHQLRLRMVTRHVPLVLWTARPDGSIDWYNDHWFEYTGQSAITSGSEWLDAVHPDDRNRTSTAWNSAVAAGAPFEAEYRLRHRTGDFRWHLARASPIRGEDGKLEKWFGTLTEVDQQKRHEEQLQEATAEAERLSALKDEFLATVSHELRTPLQAILGWASLLKANQLDSGGFARATEAIERNAKTQSRLISEILDLSRIITGRARLRTAPVNLPSVLREALETVEPAAQAKQVEIDTRIDPRIGTIVADADSLRRITWNLLSNAVKFTPKGGLVRFDAERVDHGIRVVVEDNGEGIAKGFLPFVFDPFRQARGGPDRTQQGLGLGLAIARHLVQQHGGTLAARSEGVGKGATFTLTLPHDALPETGPRSEAGDRAASEPNLPAAGALNGIRALLVDDEDDARDLISTILAQYGARVSDAASTDQALALLDHQQFDVIVSDIAMPRRDGYQLIRAIRNYADRSEISEIPAIALTAYARPADRRKALQLGYDRHLAKPVHPARLVSEIARLTKALRSTLPQSGGSA